jgi:hypothetical protein
VEVTPVEKISVEGELSVESVVTVVSVEKVDVDEGFISGEVPAQIGERKVNRIRKNPTLPILETITHPVDEYSFVGALNYSKL